MQRVMILRGISGSGKTTFQKKHCDFSCRVVSADDWFMLGGAYRFDPTELGNAHGHCLRRFIRAMGDRADVVVDNTNTTLVEIAPYISIAMAYEDASIEVVELMCDVETAAARNTHGVPLVGVQRMQENLRKSGAEWPMFWPKRKLVATSGTLDGAAWEYELPAEWR